MWSYPCTGALVGNASDNVTAEGLGAIGIDGKLVNAASVKATPIAVGFPSALRVTYVRALPEPILSCELS